MLQASISQMVKNLGGAISKNSPVILTSLAVGGVITTGVLAIRATPKALEIIKEETDKREYEVDYNGTSKPLTKRDVFLATWPCYIPAASVAVATIACIVGVNSVHSRRNAALGAVYSITESAFKNYQEHVRETIGNNKETKIRDEIAKKHVAEHPASSREVIFTGKGNVLCYDTISGRYFKSDIESIRRLENEKNRQLRDEMFISLNDIYCDLGLTPTKLGDDLGWSMDAGYIQFNYSSQLTEDGEPCLVLDYTVIPKFR